MAATKKIPIKALQRLIVCLFLIGSISMANALEFPTLKSLGLPSFKYGRLKRDPDVNKVFMLYKVLPDHKYYTTGQSSIPHAIIGIQDNYKLRLGLWREIKLTKPLLRGWVSQMDNVYGYPPYGSAILDNNGNRIGIWYSSKQWTTVIIEENNEIAVLAPETPGFQSGP
jgi:hypothetical protein